MAECYGIDIHRHRFAAWAAGRAAGRGLEGFTIDLAVTLIECSGLISRGIHPDNLPASNGEFDATHTAWRGKIIDRWQCRPNRKIEKHELSHGRAAKLINIYLKSLFICGGHHLHPYVGFIHPPIDRILLINMAKNNFHKRKDWGRIPWTKLESSDYQCLIDRIRLGLNGRPFWEIETHWHPSSSVSEM